MFAENELSIILETFRRCRVKTELLNPDSPISNTILNEHHPNINQKNSADSFKSFFGGIDENTVYKVSYKSLFNYIFLLLPIESEQPLLLIGPYLSEVLTSEKLLEMAEGFGISPSSKALFEQYYNAVPVLPYSSHLFTLLDVFCEHIWGIGRYSISELDPDSKESFTFLSENADEQDPIIKMNLMEQRYSFENQMIEAVSNGQVQKAQSLFSNLSPNALENRLSDPIRNIKNYCIIMNTLLRKAAEQGGVHPLYIDKTSSQFAHRIENLLSIAEAGILIQDLLTSYCRLVRKHTMANFSSPVQKAVIFIDSNLSSAISLKTIAQAQNMSSGYLSALFKNETGKTVTEYINEKKVALAKKLLSTTKLQIQTIAAHCGILDVQYFSKLFKKYTGLSPKEYRLTKA